ncbi:MAG TPA: hypothetical protein VEP71_04595, partial [Gallionella sp.]|nr:hypothetical protein [Gallionella sp.]
GYLCRSGPLIDIGFWLLSRFAPGESGHSPNLCFTRPTVRIYDTAAKLHARQRVYRSDPESCEFMEFWVVPVLNFRAAGQN